MKTIIRIVILLLILIFAYNYFLGDKEEKESTEKVISNFKELIGSVGTVIKSEKEKYHDGKYDNTIEKLGNLFHAIKSNINISKTDIKEEINNLELEKLEIEDEYLNLENEPDSIRERRKEELNVRLERIVRRTEELIEKSKNENN